MRRLRITGLVGNVKRVERNTSLTNPLRYSAAGRRVFTPKQK